MADALPGATNEPNSELLAALRQLSADDLAGLLKTLKAGGTDFQQFNFGNSKNFQVSVEGGKAYIADTININAEQMSLDAAMLEQLVEKLVAAQKPSIVVPYFYPSDLGSRTFVGRVEELEELHGLLQGGEQVAIAAATGMGGIGKTELAWQYCRARREDYGGGIWWLTVRGGSLASQVLGLAVRMGLGQPPESLEAEAAKVQWCFDRWGQVVAGDRLLVLDDVVEYGPLRALLPQDARFKVLLTTRRRLGPPGQRLDLGVLSEGEALELLQRLTGFDRLSQQLVEAQELCEWLGYLPLGIELVGRYLARKPGLAVATLLERLEEKRLAALALRKVPEEMPYQLNLAAAFELSWAELDGDGQRLGCLLSLFALAPIPWELVQGCVAEWDEEELEDCRDEQLLGQSLLEFVEAGRYQLHQVIRENFAAKLEEREDAEALRPAFAQILVQKAEQVPPMATLAVQKQMQEVVPHLEALVKIGTDVLKANDAIWLYVGLARLAQAQSLWDQVEKWYTACLCTTEARQGPEHPNTAASLTNLADLYHSMGRYVEAKPLCTRSLKIREERLGPNHPETAKSLNSLASLNHSMGHYAAAEPLYARALAIREERLGLKHPETAKSLNSLAGVYTSMGRYEEAEPLYVRAIKICREQLAPEHTETATSMHNLAGLYISIGSYEKAEPLYLRSLGIRERQLGLKHPETATSLNNLAGLYASTGRYAEAESLYVLSLEINEKQLGLKHPETAVSLNNLAGLYASTGRYTEAESLYIRSLEINEEILGRNHPSTAISLNDIAELYRSMGRYIEAESLHVRSLGIREERLGPEHPDTAISLNNLGLLYELTERYVEAEPLYVRALEINKKLSPEHPLTATSLNNLAGLRTSTGRYEEAEALYQQAMQIDLSVIGGDHPDTGNDYFNLAALYVQMKRYAKAELLYHKAIQVFHNSLGEDHPNTTASFNGLVNLIITAFQTGKTDELSDHPMTQNILQQVQQQAES